MSVQTAPTVNEMAEVLNPHSIFCRAQQALDTRSVEDDVRCGVQTGLVAYLSHTRRQGNYVDDNFDGALTAAKRAAHARAGDDAETLVAELLCKAVDAHWVERA